MLDIPNGYEVVLFDGKICYRDLDTGDVYDERPADKLSPLEALKAENKLLKAQIQAQADRADFVEDCIAEMAGVVYATDTTT